MKRCREEGVPMDDVRAGDGQSTDEKASSLARVLAEYFEELNFEHPDPLPPLPGKDADFLRLETALAASSKRLRQIVGDLRRYTSNVSHELVNPLSVIKSKAEVTLMKPRSTEFYEKKLSEIVEHAATMRSMIEALLELSRLDLTEKPFDIEPVDLQQVAHSACQGLSLIFNRRGQQVEKEIQPVLVKGRRPLLVTLVSNLLDNASKYSPPGGRLGIRTYPDAPSQESVLEVWDTGPGMSEEEIRQCFELFWRADGSRHMPGYGIGLPLVYRIAQIHKGKIEMRSGSGEGLLFRVRFPEA